MNYDFSNEIFGLAAQLVNQGSSNVFLTGKAGTGKTTFLKYVRQNCAKQIAVVAPTGVAAVNANGVTIHSFFQLPLCPFLPASPRFAPGTDENTSPETLISRIRMTNEKKKLLQELELLIIDEISMVRCDVLDAIDVVLRHVRRRFHERFGGVQLLLIGDMYQLSPAVKDEEWRLLCDYYSSPYFFDSKVIKEDPPVFIEFTKVYRQSEEQFIHLLNQVRNNQLDEKGESILHSRYKSRSERIDQTDHIILTTHNEKARNINSFELAKLPGEEFSFKAEIQGEFSPAAFPAEQLLQLKTGAQVMFIKNDSEKTKRFFNGKIGVITKMDDEKIFVQCADQTSEIEVRKQTWENIRYTLNKSTRQLEEQVLGSFIQYPLRLAWAITIHKSQGLTFEKAIIDAGEAFAPGQVYVALSRCTNLEGMILQSKIRGDSLFIDENIVQFSRTCSTTENLQQELELSKNKYEQRILLSIFDFDRIVIEVKEILEFLLERTASFNPETYPWIEELLNKVVTIQSIGQKFSAQLYSSFPMTKLLRENSFLKDRLGAACIYFSNELKKACDFLLQSHAQTDSRLHAKEFNETIREIFVQLSLKRFLLDGFGGSFDIDVFHERKRTFLAPQFSINAYAGTSNRSAEIPHPTLYYELKKLRDSICSKKDLPIYYVAGTRTLEEMTSYLPQTLNELEQISGFGKAKLELYGKAFLDLIVEYCKNHNLSSKISEKSPKRKRRDANGVKIDTKAETFRLYREGKNINQIAEERKLAISTIEGHLTHFIQIGEINIEELISQQKVIVMEPVVKEFYNGTLTSIRDRLGGEFSYGEIRFVCAWHEFQRQSSSHVNH